MSANTQKKELFSKGRCKRLLSWLMTIVLIVGSLFNVITPLKAKAAGIGKVIQLGTAGIVKGDLFRWGRVLQEKDENGKTYGYFGQDVYRVLDAERDNSGNTPEDGRKGYIFALADGTWGATCRVINVLSLKPDDDGETCQYMIDYVPYTGEDDAVVWPYTEGKNWCDYYLVENFSAAEQDSVPLISKSCPGGTYNISGGEYYPPALPSLINTFDTVTMGTDVLFGKAFYLSMEEVKNYFGVTLSDEPSTKMMAKNPWGQSSTTWGLRSYSHIIKNVEYNVISKVDEAGKGIVTHVYYSVVDPQLKDFYLTASHARPAFNIDHKKVLFSMASDVKKSTSSVLEAIADSDKIIGSEDDPWRFTMIDDGMKLVPGDAIISKEKTPKITLPNLSVSSTSYNRISAFVTDKVWKEGNSEGAQILYYGKLDKDNGFVLPEALKDKKAGTDYHVYVIAEYVDGDFASDSASRPVEVDIQNAKDHVHKFAEEWSSDEKYHWHACAGEGAIDSCLEEADAAKSEHMFRGGICAVCAYACKHPGVEKGLCPICGYDLDADREVVEDAVTATPDITAATTELYLIKGQKFNLPEAGYTSTDKNYVTVSSKGAVKAKKVTEPGRDVAIENGKRSISIKISEPKITKKMTIEAGTANNVQLSYDAEHLEVLWVSSAPDVVSVSKSGEIKGISKGKATVSAYINGKAFKCVVTVKETVAQATRTVHMNVNTTKKISIKGLKKYEWTVVSGNGATPKKGGKIYISQTGEVKLKTEKNGKTYEALVYVEDPTITSDKILLAGNNRYSILMKEGDKVKLKYKNVEQRVLFKSSKTAVAYDNGMGVIKAKKAGKTTLKAKINGKTVTIKIEVQK